MIISRDALYRDNASERLSMKSSAGRGLDERRTKMKSWWQGGGCRIKDGGCRTEDGKQRSEDVGGGGGRSMGVINTTLHTKFPRE